MTVCRLMKGFRSMASELMPSKKKALLQTLLDQTTTPHEPQLLVGCGTFDMTASVLHVLAETAKGAATGDRESEDGSGEE